MLKAGGDAAEGMNGKLLQIAGHVELVALTATGNAGNAETTEFSRFSDVSDSRLYCSCAHTRDRGDFLSLKYVYMYCDLIF